MKYFSILFLCIISMEIYAQKIENVVAVQNNRFIKIDYELKEVEKDMQLNTELWYTVNGNDYFQCKSIVCSWGNSDNFTPSSKQTITWNAMNDLDSLISDKLQFEIRTKTMNAKNAISFTKASLYTLTFPGLGNRLYTQRNICLMRGVLGYSFIAGNFLCSSLAVKNYNLYQNAATASDADKYMKSAKNMKTFAITSISIAAVVWIVDYFTLFKNAKKVKNKIE